MYEKLLDSLSNLPQGMLTVGSSNSDTRDKYPKVHFWSKRDFITWQQSAEGHGDPWSKTTFLEDLEGKTVCDKTLKNVHKKIQEGWAELVRKKMAPKSWGRATTSAKQIVYPNIYKSYPYLLTENNWKLKNLCLINYPGWVWNNLDKQGGWQDDDNDIVVVSATGPSKKQRLWSRSCAPEKHIKGTFYIPSLSMLTGCCRGARTT